MNWIREWKQIYTFHSNWTEQTAEHEVRNVYENASRDLKIWDGFAITGKRVLDLGCGQRFAFALQAAADGAHVTALDLDYVQPDPLPVYFGRIVRRNGLKRALKSLVRRIFWDPAYYRVLEAASGKALWKSRSGIRFVTADPHRAQYPLPAEQFDLIASNNVLEHVADLARLAAETDRLLVKGGLFYAIIHNFYSISGGHNLEWSRPDEQPPAHIPPWDHLRRNRFPTFMYLNRSKPQDYLDAFSPRFDVLRFEGVGIDNEPGRPEGERFYTPEIAAELSQYPKDLLLTRAYCMICKK